eukprot:CAMPEP_0176069146 /NCGR_PEP_ID=MMETSP0120_2-20121206/34521_1 /TAXON_ID=160619 /ORGANISM="Kryptoperidinium foliaceum, Strain CCMP 1326" /LENGTH=162 /DNA_ID=CAMNT_0017402775 /DNA_START=69 /DNA_END=557 /DNA_ORIENTATION=+
MSTMLSRLAGCVDIEQAKETTALLAVDADMDAATDGELQDASSAWAGDVRRPVRPKQKRGFKASTVLLLMALAAAVFVSGPSVRGNRAPSADGMSPSPQVPAQVAPNDVVVLAHEAVPTGTTEDYIKVGDPHEAADDGEDTKAAVNASVVSNSDVADEESGN